MTQVSTQASVQSRPLPRAQGSEVQRLAVVSDVNLANLSSLLSRGGDEGRGVRTRLLPFGEVIRPLLEESPREEGEGLLIWVRPESVLPGFRQLLDGSPPESEALDQEVEEFMALVGQAAARFPFTLMASWTPPPSTRGLGMLDMDPTQGVAGTLLRLNLALARAAAAHPGIFLLDAARWMAAGDPVEAARMWYLAKTPFSRPTLTAAAADIQAALRGLRGRARKVVVVDLDDTLWGGILGDAGRDGLRLGGHDPIGEAYVDFQRALKALTRRGVVLAVVSKNDEATALDAIRTHPEMVLRPEDLAGWRINWSDKARNVAELAQELNLGLDSFVFIDDNPSERGRVREALPQVLVPEWPSDPLRYAATLRSMDVFDLPSLNREDRERAQMYAAERQRKEARSSVGSVDEWLRSLEIRVTAEPLSETNLPRAAQLLNKTNQMNLSTRRMTEGELERWTTEPLHRLWTLRVEDRFGDYGLTGIVSLALEPEAARARIVDFVLSCRVFGRQVEETMVHLALEAAREEGSAELVATLVPTEKNAPCRTFWSERSGFETAPDGTFRRPVELAYPAPEFVTLLHLDSPEPASP
ncbi:MAG: HAD-IIIC family phosphatase [Gemmatimonadales bacterium]|nr:MAG: HAD-IIIC family phosphatase [Gemmatimonadales bacterium]